MKKISLTFIYLLAITFCYGQYRRKLINDTTGYDKYPFAIISTPTQYFKAYSYVIDYGSVISNKIDSSGIYGKFGDYIQLYKLKPAVKLLTTEDLLKKYHIKSTYHNLPIYIDSIIIRHRESAWFQLSAVVSVKVRTEKNSDSKYISVRTVHHPDNSFSDVYLYGTCAKPKDNN